MAPVLICPRCKGHYDKYQQCPVCGGGLESSPSPSVSITTTARTAKAEKWQQTPEGRIIIGFLLSLGLCYGLLQLGMALLLGMGRNAASGLNPVIGLALFHSLQAFAVLPAGMLAGAGQRRATMLGAGVGLLSGLTFVAGMLSGILTNLVQSFSQELLAPGTPVHDIALISLPIGHTVVGAIGGFLGGSIWKPLQDVTIPVVSAQKRVALRREASSKRLHLHWKGPMAWGRLLAGASLAALGGINTPWIVDSILSISDQQLVIMTQLEDQIVYGEVFAISILLGGCIAGAGSLNGLKQGACMGLALAFLFAGVFWKGTDSFSVAYPVFCAMILAPIGGWFGSELLPPVSRFRKKRRTDWA